MSWFNLVDPLRPRRRPTPHYTAPINGKKGRRAHAANRRAALKKRRRK